jgi:hypothetical protein
MGKAAITISRELDLVAPKTASYYRISVDLRNDESRKARTRSNGRDPVRRRIAIFGFDFDRDRRSR